MASEITRNMTKGEPLKLIIGFSLPVLIGYLFQQIYTVTDTAIVGKVLGEKALAAVGSIGSVNWLILGFCNGIGAGFAIPIAQCFGAKKYDRISQGVRTSIKIGLVFSICAFIVQWIFGRSIVLIFLDANAKQLMVIRRLWIIFR